MKNRQMYMISVISVLCLLVACLPIGAQTMLRKTLISKRMQQIDYYHAGLGFEVMGARNFAVGPKLFLGMGTFRNIVNADVGIKFLMFNPVSFNHKENLRLQQIPVFAKTSLNVMHGHNYGLYIGGEVSYNLCVGSSHVLPAYDITETDAQIGKHYMSLAPCIGGRTDRLDICVFCEYRFSPAVNQKYIFESQEYDYDVLRDSIFERLLVGLSVSYLLPF